jgi:hypothetical protein
MQIERHCHANNTQNSIAYIFFFSSSHGDSLAWGGANGMGSSGLLSGIGILGILGTKVGISGFGGNVTFGISGNGGSSTFGISGFGGNVTFGISGKGGSSTFGTDGKGGCSTSGSGSVGSGKVGVSEWTGEAS